MNRLWTRLSLTNALVVIVVLMTVAVSIRLFGDGASTPIPAGMTVTAEEQAAIDVLRSSGFIDRLSRETAGQLPLGTIYVFTVTGVVAIIAGIVLSRRLTTPLDNLQNAARAIGTSQFSHRVEPQGTVELVELANTFNQMAAQLEQAEQLRSNLLSDVAHELRNPLHIIEGNLRAILDGVYPLEMAEIARLLGQTEQLRKLVNDLHELAQAEARQLPLDKTAVDIAALVKETAVSFKPTAAAQNITLDVALQGAMPTLSLDASRVKQVLHNLISNALRHTPKNGKVTIIVENIDQTLSIQIQDSGAGIEAEHLPHVFDRFYRTDSARSRDAGGTGLGLAIAKAIVEAHGGGITAVSDGLNQGSTFTIHLPVN